MQRLLCLAFLVALVSTVQGGEKAGKLYKDSWLLRGNSAESRWRWSGAATLDDKGKLVFNNDEVACPEIVNTSKDGACDAYTFKEFADCRVEIEVLVPKGSWSGILLMGRYEILLAESSGVKNPGLTDMGAIANIAIPKVNACKNLGDWQKFVIDFQAPRFDGKKKTANAIFDKVLLNGELIHEKIALTKGSTDGGKGGPLDYPPGYTLGEEVATCPLMLKGHGGPMAFRNLRITAKK
jgi:hypothetical protein